MASEFDGAVALVVGVILFPADPLPRLKQGERAVLRSLASAAEQVADVLRTGRGAPPGWALAIGHEIHEQLSILAQARMTARANARIAPRRWRRCRPPRPPPGPRRRPTAGRSRTGSDADRRPATPEWSRHHPGMVARTLNPDGVGPASSARSGRRQSETLPAPSMEQKLC